MSVNLYYPNNTERLFTFSLLTSVNSVTTFIFSYTDNEPTTINTANMATLRSRLVSGYEKTHRNISTTITIAHNLPTRPINAYIASCVRLPFVAANMLNGQIPVLVVITCAHDTKETQIWHIFNVSKSRESLMCKKILGVTVCDNIGTEHYVPKEYIVLSGNVVSSFVNALSKSTTKRGDVDIGLVAHPNLKINSHSVSIKFSDDRSRT
ncbi:ac146-like protein [Clanis bilineata nucleopolyhedrovirus]|uniref:Ac146-like protein n=1 Tax=Clanis bilineata nucleopolyhedrovirus TaxID=1307957 RepID=Q0N490_9ABAC|nr:ac146-like protein [Clanis bilineata nucleopolyhedrovirus]ABF47353.1 ac146-like protein [Clanis bilineata nucleopolyhedrovirus]